MSLIKRFPIPATHAALLGATLALTACHDGPTAPEPNAADLTPASVPVVPLEEIRASLAALDDPLLGTLIAALDDAAAGETLRTALIAVRTALHLGEVAAAVGALEAVQRELTGHSGETATDDDRIALGVLGLTLARIGERLAALVPSVAAQAELEHRSHSETDSYVVVT